MKLVMDKLGVLRKSELELAQLTVVCGKNNTGKTYATYALYGFLGYWHNGFRMDIPEQIINTLKTQGHVRIVLDDVRDIIKRGVDKATAEYVKILPRIYAAAERKFEGVIFEVEVNTDDIQPRPGFEQNYRLADRDLLSVKLSEDASCIDLVLINPDKEEVIDVILSFMLNTCIKDAFAFAPFPEAFIVSAERTGVAIFRKELDITRSRLIQQLAANTSESPMKILRNSYQDYPLPVTDNIEFNRNVDSIVKEDSFIAKSHQDILDLLGEVTGGDYLTNKEAIYFVPFKSKTRLSLVESSSGVRSLVDFAFYLRHKAKPGDLLMIDEPEMNLHISNQRKLARLLARLVNLGIRIYVTTHSDTLVRELNTLILLKHRLPSSAEYARSKGYIEPELLDRKQVIVYMAKQTRANSQNCYLQRAVISADMGIEAETFDNELNEMMEIQRDIMFGVAGEPTDGAK